MLDLRSKLKSSDAELTIPAEIRPRPVSHESHHCGFEHATCGFSINSLTYSEVKDYESKEYRSTTLLSVDNLTPKLIGRAVDEIPAMDNIACRQIR